LRNIEDLLKQQKSAIEVDRREWQSEREHLQDTIRELEYNKRLREEEFAFIEANLHKVPPSCESRTAFALLS
jgi:hypothetical protein